MGKKILVIDDTVMIVGALNTILQEAGHEVKGVVDAESGEKEALSGEYDLIVVDLKMPNKSGAEVVKNIKNAKEDAKILLITGYPTDPMLQEALDAGAIGYLKKPFKVDEIYKYLDA